MEQKSGEMARRPQHDLNEPKPVVEPRSVEPRLPEASQDQPARQHASFFKNHSPAEFRSASDVLDIFAEGRLKVFENALSVFRHHEAAGDVVGALKAFSLLHPDESLASRAILSELSRVCEKLLLRLAYTGHEDKADAGFRILERIIADTFPAHQKDHVVTLRSICNDLVDTLIRLNISYNYKMGEKTGLYSLEDAEREIARRRGLSVETMRVALDTAAQAAPAASGPATSTASKPAAANATASDADAVKLVFGDIPERFRTGTYTKNPHPELVHHPAVFAQAKEIVSANRRTKIAELPPADQEILRQARRVVRANERHPDATPRL